MLTIVTKCIWCGEPAKKTKKYQVETENTMTSTPTIEVSTLAVCQKCTKEMADYTNKSFEVFNN